MSVKRYRPTVTDVQEPIKGGKRYGAGQNGGPCVFVCADCARQARVISGTGNSSEQRELAALNRGLRA
jgi:hypothetical protein